jgi:hypothetical protein
MSGAAFVCPVCSKPAAACEHVRTDREFRLTTQGPGGVEIVVERATPARVSIVVGARSTHDQVRAAVPAALAWRDALRQTSAEVGAPASLSPYDMTMFQLSTRQRAGKSYSALAEDVRTTLNAWTAREIAEWRLPLVVKRLADRLASYGVAAEDAETRARAAIAEACEGREAFPPRSPLDGDTLTDRLKVWRRSPEGKRLDKTRRK